MKIIHIAAILAAIILVFFLAKLGFNSGEAIVDPTAVEEPVGISENTSGEDSHNDSQVHEELSRFERLLDSNQLSNDEKVEYARLKIEHAHGNEDVMTGVRTLLAVVQNDSNHIKAIESLAELSIQSGQFEKARERYKKLLTLQPQNESYRRMIQELDRRIGGQ